MDATKGRSEGEAEATTAQSAPRDERRARYVEEHNQCAMCATELEIVHEIRSFEAILTEEAHCPNCAVRVRAVRHRLH